MIVYMKKLILLVTVLSICSCSTIRTSTSTALDVKTDLSIVPTVSDLEVQTGKVSATINLTKQERRSYTAEQIRSTVVAKALETSGADVLVNPIYTVETRLGRIRSISVKGYPATYKNFREDKEYLERMKQQNPVVVINQTK